MSKQKTFTKPAADPSASSANGQPLTTYAVRVRSLFGEAVITVPATSPTDARQRVIDGFAAGVTVEGG